MKKGKDLKPHIGIFGRRNNGKSSFINALTGQDVAIVSDQAGTTTDPVKKSVEIFGIGPAIMIDTAGIDDVGELGKKRIKKSLDVITNIDMAILLIADNEFDDFEIELLKKFKAFDIPTLVVHNKADKEDLKYCTHQKVSAFTESELVEFSSLNDEYKEDVIDAIKRTIPETAYQQPSLFQGILKPKDVVLLITPIDSEAPDGRMILPQVMAWRDVLDKDCICISVKENELEDFLSKGLKPDIAVTDSQVFEYVSSVLPSDIPLTSFSILFARMKGDLNAYMHGTKKLDTLKNGDKILILESCTHQVSCDDIGRYKIPNWLKEHTQKDLHFDFLSGLVNPPEDISKYALVIQCGGCMATRKQILNRIKLVTNQEVPVSNYGLMIAYVNGIFNRVIEPFISHENKNS